MNLGFSASVFQFLLPLKGHLSGSLGLLLLTTARCYLFYCNLFIFCIIFVPGLFLFIAWKKRAIKNVHVVLYHLIEKKVFFLIVCVFQYSPHAVDHLMEMLQFCCCCSFLSSLLPSPLTIVCLDWWPCIVKPNWRNYSCWTQHAGNSCTSRNNSERQNCDALTMKCRERWKSKLCVCVWERERRREGEIVCTWFWENFMLNCFLISATLCVWVCVCAHMCV